MVFSIISTQIFLLLPVLMIRRMKVSVIDFSCNNFQNLAKVQDVFAEYISSFLYIDNEEDETKNVMNNASNFPSSFVSEELQGEKTCLQSLPQERTPPHSLTHIVSNKTAITSGFPVVITCSSIVITFSSVISTNTDCFIR